MIKLGFSAIVLGVVALQACASAENVVIAKPGVPFSLLVGETAVLSASQLTFRQVREDSRCPANAVCIWEGDAKIDITVSRSSGAGESKVISLRPPNNEVRVGDLLVQFLMLTPYPGTYDPSTPRPYIAELVIRTL